jgi:hypothetical protein
MTQQRGETTQNTCFLNTKIMFAINLILSAVSLPGGKAATITLH